MLLNALQKAREHLAKLSQILEKAFVSGSKKQEKAHLHFVQLLYSNCVIRAL